MTRMIQTQIYGRKTPDPNNNSILLYLHDYMKLQYCTGFKIKLHWIKTNDYYAMRITMVNQVSSLWFENKLLSKSLHNETKLNNFNNFIDVGRRQIRFLKNLPSFYLAMTSQFPEYQTFVNCFINN